MRLGETAEGVELVEFFMNKLSDTPISGETTATVGLSKGELETMMRDPRYWDNTRRDPSFVKQVDEGFSKLYK
jgi:cytochrome c1